MDGVYGGWHIIVLVLTIVGIVGGCILVRKYCKTEQAKSITYKIVAGVLLVFVLATRIADAIIKKNGFELVPYTQCCLTALLLVFGAFFVKNKNSPLFHCIVFIGLVCFPLNQAYPGFFNEDSIHHTATIFEWRAFPSLVYHSIAWFLSILFVATGDFKPDWKKLRYLAIGYCIYVAWGLFVKSITTLAGFPIHDIMFLDEPLLEGTIFHWWFVALLYGALLFGILFTIQTIVKRKKA